MIQTRWIKRVRAVLLLASLLSFISCAASSTRPHGGYIRIYENAPKGIGYQQLGIVESHLLKSSFESVSWWRKQAESRLQKKARELGADALIHARFNPTTGNASAVAIKYREIFPEEESV